MAGRPFPGWWQEYSGASCCLTFMRNVACRFHLRHFALLFALGVSSKKGAIFMESALSLAVSQGGLES